jgi:hypothetical protein
MNKQTIIEDREQILLFLRGSYFRNFENYIEARTIDQKWSGSPILILREAFNQIMVFWKV